MMRKKEKKKKKEKAAKKGKEKDTCSSSGPEAVSICYSSKAQRTLLVVDSDSRDWRSLFRSIQGLKVEQCEWKDMIVQAESNGSALVNFVSHGKETKVCQPGRSVPTSGSAAAESKS